MTGLAVVEELRARPGSGETITLIDPVTEEQIGEFRDGGAAAIDAAVARARATFDSGIWRNKPGSEKAKILWKVADRLEARAEELAQIDSFNTGMPISQATRNMDAVIEYFRYFAGWCTKIQGVSRDVRMSGGLNGYDATIHNYTLKEPVGVV